MTNGFVFHDLTITGLSFDRTLEELVMQGEAEDGHRVALKFSGIAGFELSPFQEQNVLFDLKEGGPIPEEMQYYAELIDSCVKRFYELEPSVGLGGYVVASALDIVDVEHLPICTGHVAGFALGGL